MVFAVILLLLCAEISVSASDPYSYRDYQCIIVPGKLNQIDAGAGEVYGVNDNDDIFRWVVDDWQQVPGSLIHVSPGPAGVWGVNSENKIFKLENNGWVLKSGLLKQLDSGGDQFLSGVNAQNAVYCLRPACTVSKSSLVSYTQLDGSLIYYSCGPLGCWGTNSANDIYFRRGVTAGACQGTSWQQIDGKLVMIEAGADGSVYGVNSVGDVYRREGITAEIPTGVSWTKLDFCDTFKHVTFDASYLWLINTSGDIYRCAK